VSQEFEGGNLGKMFVSDVLVFGLQGAGGRREHIIFCRKEAKKEIDRGSSCSLVIVCLPSGHEKRVFPSLSSS
jgi:hypothetical protein